MSVVDFCLFDIYQSDILSDKGWQSSPGRWVVSQLPVPSLPLEFMAVWLRMLVETNLR